MSAPVTDACSVVVLSKEEEGFDDLGGGVEGVAVAAFKKSGVLFDRFSSPEEPEDGTGRASMDVSMSRGSGAALINLPLEKSFGFDFALSSVSFR